MKKCILSHVGILYIITCFAQEPTFTWSLANTKPSMQVDVQLFGYNSQGYYIVNKKPASGTEFSPTITVEYFNGKQERVFTKNVTPTVQEDLVNLVYFNDALYLLKGLFNKDAGKNVLSATAIRRDGSLDKPVELATLLAEKLSARGRFDAAVSPDGSKLLVLSQPNYTKDANEKINLTLYSGPFNKVWSSDQTYLYAWTKAVDNTPFINNEGTSFILKRTDMKGSDNTYSIFSFEGKVFKEYKIALDGKKKVASIVQAFSPEGDFVAGGYYTEDGKVSLTMGTSLHGYFLQRIDHTGAGAKIAATNPFEKRKGIVAKRIVFNNDRCLLLGENYFITSRSAQHDPSVKLSTEDMFAMDYSYYGLDINIDGFDETGKLLYSSTIDKNNNSKNDNGTWVSYFSAIINGKLYIIFNDDKYKYDEKKHVFVMGSPKIVVFTTIDPATGTVAKVLPVSNTGPVGGKSGDMLLRPDVFLKVDETHYLTRAENTSIYRTGLVDFSSK